ncbi:MAG: metalloregulator ArsR/SmtB family transcription factor [Pseudomonadota bacterium]
MDQLVDILKAAADPTRAKIICLCRRAELSVSELTRILGQSQPRVSRHLKILVDAGLLDRYREGQFALFRLSARGLPGDVAGQIARWSDEAEESLAPELATLRQVIADRAAAAGEYFASNADRWDEIRQLHIGDEQVEQAILDRLGGDPIDLLVDLGTGTGRMIELAGPIANQVIGIDLSRDMLAMARGNLFKAQASVGDLGFDWQVRQGDLHRLPLDADSADAAIMHQVLHFLEDPQAALADVGRILRPGGRLVLVDFAPHHIEALRRDHAHTWLGFSSAEVSSWLAQAGFSSIEVDKLPGTPLTILVWQAVAGGQSVAPEQNLKSDDGFVAEAI